MRLIFSFGILLILASATARGAESDKACAPNGGGLAVLTNCGKTYCKSATKVENARDNIKFIDEALASFQKANAKMSVSVDKYQSACRALMRNYCLACPLMDIVNISVLDVQIDSKPSDEIEKTVRSQEFFRGFAGRISREENDKACGAQIVALAEKISNDLFEATLRFANTKCEK